MKYTSVFIAYFIYMAFILTGTAYLIYWKGADSELWILALLLAFITPEVTLPDKK